MSKSSINTEKDLHDFFEAFNSRDWEKAFSYLDDNCIWDASEKPLAGKKEISEYWLNSRTQGNSAVKENLGKPHNITISGRFVYLQTLIHFDFIQDGIYRGKDYKKGETLEFLCCDSYELNEYKQIKLALIFTKIFNGSRELYIKPEWDLK